MDTLLLSSLKAKFQMGHDYQNIWCILAYFSEHDLGRVTCSTTAYKIHIFTLIILFETLEKCLGH
jgi:hypothetical protein